MRERLRSFVHCARRPTRVRGDCDDKHTQCGFCEILAVCYAMLNLFSLSNCHMVIISNQRQTCPSPPTSFPFTKQESRERRTTVTVVKHFNSFQIKILSNFLLKYVTAASQTLQCGIVDNKIACVFTGVETPVNVFIVKGGKCPNSDSRLKFLTVVMFFL